METTITSKTCTKCLVEKPVTEFWNLSFDSRYKRHYCKPCGRSWRKTDAGVSTRLKSIYGIDVSTYNEMLKLQDGKCAICKKLPGKRRFNVDHNHNTNEIRGLLCMHCNLMIGFFEKNRITVKMIAEYLNVV